MSEIQSTSTHTDRVDLAGKVAFEAASFAPRYTDWAMLVVDDHPPIFCGSGMSCFLWFVSEAEVIDFLAHHLPFFVDAGLDEEECIAMAQDIEAIGRECDAKSAALSDRICALNDHLQHLVRVEWAGPVSELLEGCGKPEAFREWFRQTTGDEVSSSPIPLVQQDAFLAALSQYGA